MIINFSKHNIMSFFKLFSILSNQGENHEITINLERSPSLSPLAHHRVHTDECSLGISDHKYSVASSADNFLILTQIYGFRPGDASRLKQDQNLVGIDRTQNVTTLKEPLTLHFTQLFNLKQVKIILNELS